MWKWNIDYLLAIQEALLYEDSLTPKSHPPLVNLYVDHSPPLGSLEAYEGVLPPQSLHPVRS